MADMLPPEVVALAQSLQNTPEPLLYKSWLKVYSDMITHTQGRIAGKLKTKRPGEPSDIYEYRVANGRAVTKGSMQKAISNISRIFQSQSWSFTGSDALVNYITTTMFNGLTFRQWNERHIIPLMIEDPNAIIIWLPDGEGYEPVIYNSRKIRYISNNAIVVADCDVKKSAVELLQINATEDITQRNFVKKEQSFIAATKWGVFRIELRQEKKIITPVIQQEFDFAPYTTLGGIMTGMGYYESFFQAFCPFGDEALTEYSDHQAVNVTFAYPVREELGDKCNADGCRNGRVMKDGVETVCSSCHGAGRLPFRSPYGVYFKKETSALTEGQPPQNTVDFRSPDVGILKYSSEEWAIKLRMGEDAIHLVRIWDNQSGVAKLIDREGLYSMLTDIKNNVFDNVIYKSLLILENYLQGETKVQPIVYKPVDITIKTNGDLIDEVKAVSDHNIPKFIVSQTVIENAMKKYTDNDPRRRIIEILGRIDPLFAYSQSEKERISALVDKNIVTRSIVLPGVLDAISKSHPDFMKMTDEQVMKIAEPVIESYYPKGVTLQYDYNGNAV